MVYHIINYANNSVNVQEGPERCVHMRSERCGSRHFSFDFITHWFRSTFCSISVHLRTRRHLPLNHDVSNRETVRLDLHNRFLWWYIKKDWQFDGNELEPGNSTKRMLLAWSTKVGLSPTLQRSQPWVRDVVYMRANIVSYKVEVTG